MRTSLAAALGCLIVVGLTAPAAVAAPINPCEQRCQLRLETQLAKATRAQRACAVKADSWRTKREAKAKRAGKDPSVFAAIKSQHAVKTSKCTAKRERRHAKAYARDRKCTKRCG